jgi:ABC-type branched-subunit amino acid transport system substrate-binding protein
VKRRLATLALIPLLVTACGAGDGDRVAAPGTPGVTSAPCPVPVNPANGCIYLGTLTDLTGPFQLAGSRATDAQRAFWTRVNKQGGIGGYDIDVSVHVVDTGYDVPRFVKAYGETKNKVLAYAQLIGSPQTAAVLPDLAKESIIGAPVGWTSQWAFEDNVLESGGNYCFEAMNAVDYGILTAKTKLKGVMAVHYPGDYGGDAAAGARIAARARNLAFRDVPTPQGANLQGPVIEEILKVKPGMVVLSTSPAEAGVIVAQTIRRGFKGTFIGSSPTWNEDLAKGPLGKILKHRFLQTGAWRPFATDSPGHAAMRAALGSVIPSDKYVSGWAFSYPLKAALVKAAASGEITRTSLFTASRQLTSVDYEGVLPPKAGNFAGDANAHAFRETVISQPDESQVSGIRVLEDFYTGQTARSYSLNEPCFKAKS